MLSTVSKHASLTKYVINGHGKISNWENYDPEGLEEERYEANREEYILASTITNPHNVAYGMILATSNQDRNRSQIFQLQ
jgi:hypothetical protein